MTIDMNFAVIGLFALQVLGLVGVAFVLWRIKAGPVAAIQSKITPLVEGGKSLAETGKSFAAHIPRAKLLGESAKTTKEALQLAPPPAGMLLTPQRLLQGFGLARAARTTFKTRKLPAKKPSLAYKAAHRIGLIPPAAQRLGKVFGIAQTALRVAKNVRKR